MKALQKVSKFLSDYTSIVVIAIAVITFFVPGMMGWVNLQLFTDPVSNRFTCQSIIIGVIMFSMGLTLTTEDFKILAQRPFDICVGAIAQYLIMPFLALGLTKLLNLPDGIALGLILVGCCPGGVSSNIMSYLCGGDVAFSVGMTTVSTILSPVMTPFLVSFLASGTHISIKALPMLVSIVETVILPVALGFLLNYLFGKKKTFGELQKIMPGIAVLGLACVVGGVVSSQGAKFFESGVVIFVAVFLHNGLGYLLGYGAGRLVGMNTRLRSRSVCRMQDLQPILLQRQLSLHLHRSQRSSVQYPAHGIQFQEHYWQECLHFMINANRNNAVAKET